MSQNNIYDYKTTKSGNEETGFFNIKGRISRKPFFSRWALAIGIYFLSAVLYISGIYGQYDSRAYIFFETIHIYLLPLLLILFTYIQGAKRMHDVNKSGWYFLIPVYNLYLIFSPGSKGNNDYGIDPTPVKNIQYFDELEVSDDKLVALPMKKIPVDKVKITNGKIFTLNTFNILVLLFFCNIVPIYVFYHPGTLYSSSHLTYYSTYKHTESWNIVFIFTIILFIFGLKNLNRISYLFASLFSISYIVGLYFYPYNYFSLFEDYHINNECMIYSISIMAYNIVLSFFALKNTINNYIS